MKHQEKWWRHNNGHRICSVLQLHAPCPIFTRIPRCISLLIPSIDHSLSEQSWNNFATPQYWVDWQFFLRVFCKLLQLCDRWVKNLTYFPHSCITLFSCDQMRFSKFWKCRQPLCFSSQRSAQRYNLHQINNEQKEQTVSNEYSDTETTGCLQVKSKTFSLLNVRQNFI